MVAGRILRLPLPFYLLFLVTLFIHSDLNYGSRCKDTVNFSKYKILPGYSWKKFVDSGKDSPLLIRGSAAARRRGIKCLHMEGRAAYISGSHRDRYLGIPRCLSLRLILSNIRQYGEGDLYL